MDISKIFVFCNILFVMFCIWLISSNKCLYKTKLLHSSKGISNNGALSKQPSYLTEVNKYSVWGNWVGGKCSVTCGNGIKVLRRKCLQANCQGNLTKNVHCRNSPCVGGKDFDWIDVSVRKRLSEIKNRCVTYNPRSKNDIYSRMVYNDKYKFIFCEVPKAASTTWRKFLWHFAGQPDYKTVSEDDIIIGHNKEFKLIRTLSKEEREQKVANYTKFFVQRHPFERLVSAYFSKFTNKGKRVYYKNNFGKPAANKYMPQLVHGVKIRNFTQNDFENQLNKSKIFQNLKSSQQKEVLDAVKKLRKGEVSFEIFLKIVFGQYDVNGYLNTDIHWRNMVDLCFPCQINYDYVIDFNNLAEDSNNLLKYLQKKEPEKERIFINERKTEVVKSSAFSTINKLPNKTVFKIKQLFKDDFYIFGYNSTN